MIPLAIYLVQLLIVTGQLYPTQLKFEWQCTLEWVVQWVKTDLLEYSRAPSGFYDKCNGESDYAIFFHFRSCLATRNCVRKKVVLPLKSKYFFQRMFGLWYLKEAYSKYRNNAPKILTIRVTVMVQLMKMFQNCAVLRNCAILERFHELLRNSNYD